jgi:hypothetical protein
MSVRRVAEPVRGVTTRTATNGVHDERSPTTLGVIRFPRGQPGCSGRPGGTPKCTQAWHRLGGKFFTQGSHHGNVTVVYTAKSLFNQNKSMRSVSLNAHYIIPLKNLRHRTQIQTLVCQISWKSRTLVRCIQTCHNCSIR